jgi:hypothetical protein
LLFALHLPKRRMFNEWYAKDTSKKIRAVMKVKGNAGEHLTTNAPYGYMKDPDDSKRWIIHAATDPHSKINRRQEVDIYYKGIGILEMSKVFDSRQK